MSGSNACSFSNGGCPQLCLPIPYGRRCACTRGNTSDCQPLVVTSPNSLTVEETNSLTLTCTLMSSNATGLTYVSAQWLKNGIVINSYDDRALRYTNTISMEIPSVDSNSSGSYACLAVNKYGAAHSSAANVKVMPRNSDSGTVY